MYSTCLVVATLAIGAHVCAGASNVDPSAPIPGIVDLSPSTFDKYVNGTQHAIVQFYATWCGHSKAMFPELTKLGQLLLTDPTLGNRVVFGKVNADEDRSLGERFNVRGFPIIKYFKRGEIPHKEAESFKGARTAVRFIEFLQQKFDKEDEEQAAAAADAAADGIEAAPDLPATDGGYDGASDAAPDLPASGSSGYDGASDAALMQAAANLEAALIDVPPEPPAAPSPEFEGQTGPGGPACAADGLDAEQGSCGAPFAAAPGEQTFEAIADEADQAAAALQAAEHVQVPDAPPTETPPDAAWTAPDSLSEEATPAISDENAAAPEAGHDTALSTSPLTEELPTPLGVTPGSIADGVTEALNSLETPKVFDAVFADAAAATAEVFHDADETLGNHGAETGGPSHEDTVTADTAQPEAPHSTSGANGRAPDVAVDAVPPPPPFPPPPLPTEEPPSERRSSGFMRTLSTFLFGSSSGRGATAAENQQPPTAASATPASSRSDSEPSGPSSEELDRAAAANLEALTAVLKKLRKASSSFRKAVGKVSAELQSAAATGALAEATLQHVAEELRKASDGAKEALIGAYDGLRQASGGAWPPPPPPPPPSLPPPASGLTPSAGAAVDESLPPSGDPVIDVGQVLQGAASEWEADGVEAAPSSSSGRGGEAGVCENLDENGQCAAHLLPRVLQGGSLG